MFAFHPGCGERNEEAVNLPHLFPELPALDGARIDLDMQVSRGLGGQEL